MSKHHLLASGGRGGRAARGGRGGRSGARAPKWSLPDASDARGSTNVDIYFKSPGGSSGVTGLSSEADEAIARPALHSRATGLASEVDSALALSVGAAGISAGMAVETNSAIALLANLARPVGVATEIDQALALSRMASVGAAIEVDTALALAAQKEALLMQGGGDGPSEWLRKKIIREFVNEAERKKALKALPKVSEVERVTVKTAAAQVARMPLVSLDSIERSLQSALKDGGIQHDARHVEWLLYFLRVEAFKIAQEDEEEEAMCLVMMLS